MSDTHIHSFSSSRRLAPSFLFSTPTFFQINYSALIRDAYYVHSWSKDPGDRPSKRRVRFETNINPPLPTEFPSAAQSFQATVYLDTPTIPTRKPRDPTFKMRTSAILTLLAGAAAVTATYPEAPAPEADTTTTMTSTLTKTVTLTSCGPDVPDCPAQSTPEPEPTTEVPAPEPTTEAASPESTSAEPEPEPKTSEAESSYIYTPPSNSTATSGPTASKPPVVSTSEAESEPEPEPTEDESPEATEPPTAGAATASLHGGLLFGAAVLGLLALN